MTGHGARGEQSHVVIEAEPACSLWSAKMPPSVGPRALTTLFNSLSCGYKSPRGMNEHVHLISSLFPSPQPLLLLCHPSGMCSSVIAKRQLSLGPKYVLMKKSIKPQVSKRAILLRRTCFIEA